MSSTERENDPRRPRAAAARPFTCDHLGYFKNHLLWHLALMHLAEGRYDRVRKLFQSVFGDVEITVGSDLQDSVALAWRLDLYGQPDPRRWQHLGAAARGWLEAIGSMKIASSSVPVDGSAMSVALR